MNAGFADLALTLSFEFDKYLAQHLKVARQIPRGAQLAFELKGNPRFNRWSRSLARSQAKSGAILVTVCVEAMRPPISRIQRVRLAT